MATSIIKLHPFSGTNEDEPPCYLLQIDDFHCLLDCGWDSKFSDNYVLQVAKYAKIINAVFISHSDIRHMGALPYLVGKCGLNCPVYMTGPVSKMGHLFLYDAYLSICKSEEFIRFNLDDVDAIFDLAVTLKYQETRNLHGKGQGVTVTPYVAGHMIGGAIWKIVKDDLEIVYAIDYNHKKENHLNGAMFSHIQRPHLLITSSYHSFQKMSKKHKEEVLKQTINETLRKNGNILFLSDTAGRSLELAYLLEKLWRNQKSGLMANGLAFVNNESANVIEFAKSNVEWLSDDLTRGFESSGWKPFHLKYTTLCHGMDDVNCVAEPMVAVVSQSHLNYGFGRELFSKWCENENNLVVVTTRVREKGLASDLFNYALQCRVNPEVFKLTFKEEPRVSNEDFLMKLTKESLFPTDNTKLNKSILESAPEIDDDDDDYEDDLSSDDDNADTSKTERDQPRSKKLKESKDYPFQDENGISSDGTGFHLPGFDIYPDQHSHSGPWFRATKRLSLVFPSTERKIQWDDYGEHIDVKDPNFLNTAGSSYAMDVINQSLMPTGVNKAGPIHESNMSVIRDQIMHSFETTRTQACSTIPIRDLTVKCSVIFQDNEGLADFAAMRQMITACKPQEIIIVGGSKQDSETMANFCKNTLPMKESLVHVAESGQVVNCTKEGHIYQARLSDALVSSLKFQKVGDYELAWIDAVIKMPVSGAVNDEEPLVAVNHIPILELPDGAIPEHKTIFVNEPKLSDLKQLLIKNHMNAEFNGGVLVVDNCVAIKKTEAGKLMLEGIFSEAYFKVRELLYSQFVIL